MIKAVIKFSSGKSYELLFEAGNPIAEAIVAHLPLAEEAKNIVGEVFFRTDHIDIPFNGNEKSDFDIGDVVYWRSSKGDDKFAIALFYGNTKFSDWKKPTAASPCVKIGKLLGKVESLSEIQSGESASVAIL